MSNNNDDKDKDRIVIDKTELEKLLRQRKALIDDKDCNKDNKNDDYKGEVMCYFMTE